MHGSTPNFIYVGTMSADVSLPAVGSSGPWGRVEGELKTPKNRGWSHSCIGQLPFCIFLSASKCGSIYRAQTCAHSGVEPSRSAKAIPQGGPKSSKKFRIFHHFQTLRPYISETIKNRGISAEYGKKVYPSPIQLSHVYGPIAHGVLQGGPKIE